jgi:hypothetical protein
MSYQQEFNFAAAAAAFVAAALWFWASRAKVAVDYAAKFGQEWPTEPNGSPLPYLTFLGGHGPLQHDNGQIIDVTATLTRQGRLNAQAATAAAIAALLQGIALMLPSS